MSIYNVVTTFTDELATFDNSDAAIRYAIGLGNHFCYMVIDGIAATDHDVARADAREYAEKHPEPTYVCSGCGGNHPYYYCGADDSEPVF